MAGTIAVDLDGTLAEFHGWDGGSIGPPIPAMVKRVQHWLGEGRHVCIFTARVAYDGGEQRARIEAWCLEHLGRVLQVTALKDYSIDYVYDDRAIQVETNTGRLIAGDAP